MKPQTEELRKSLASLPHSPGVYQYFDEVGTLIYVGKAKNLKKRVSSYFSKDRYDSGKTRLLVKKIRSLRFIIVDTEYDALLLENTLIKKHQPRFNIQMRDDKSFPWICIKKERFPRVFPTRTVVKDGSQYFGPYASVKNMNTVLDLIRTLYKVRTCKYDLSQESIDKGKFRVCLEYHIGNCLGPCVGKQEEESYNQSIEEIRAIVKGNIQSVIRIVKDRMKDHAENLEFEKAQNLKVKLDALEKYQGKSTVVNPSIHNVDVFSILSDDKFGYVNYMKLNNGAVIQSHTLEMRKRLEETEEDLLVMAITELRQRFESTSETAYVPLLPQMEIPGINFHVPQRGDKKKLMDLSQRNARYFMVERQKQQDKVDPDRHANRVLAQMQKDLRMREEPRHIECFDNSNFQGSFPVAACVVFKDAKPSKKDYRHFNIKTVEGPNDFASMEEVVYRRYKRMLDEDMSLPQLIIVDGGKGQLSSALLSLDRLGLRGKITIVGIAKRLEEIYFPGDSLPLYIDKRSESLKVIQHLRNEAHRFGITHHRNQRSKGTITTELNQIKGIGKSTSEQLLKAFKSVKRIREASEKDLVEVVGLGKAKLVIAHFQENK